MERGSGGARGKCVRICMYCSMAKSFGTDFVSHFFILLIVFLL